MLSSFLAIAHRLLTTMAIQMIATDSGKEAYDEKRVAISVMIKNRLAPDSPNTAIFHQTCR
ncbi:MAG: hypothetical protein WBA57_05860 [Elainellaceae cyanobacterium]